MNTVHRFFEIALRHRNSGLVVRYFGRPKGKVHQLERVFVQGSALCEEAIDHNLVFELFLFSVALVHLVKVGKKGRGLENKEDVFLLGNLMKKKTLRKNRRVSSKKIVRRDLFPSRSAKGVVLSVNVCHQTGLINHNARNISFR